MNFSKMGILSKAIVCLAGLLIVITHQACGRFSFQAKSPLDELGSSSLGSNAPPGATPPVTTVPEDSILVKGQKIYAANCAVCHQSLDVSTKLYKSKETIQNALATIPDMAHLKGLAAGDIEAISVALNQVACAPTAQNTVIAAPLRLLNNREYTYSITDVLGTNIQLTAGLIGQTVGAAGFDNEAQYLKIDGLTFEKMLTAVQSVASEFAKKPRAGILACSTADGGTTSTTVACAKTVILNVATMAYRRPLLDQEKTDLNTIVQNSYNAASTAEKFQAGVETGVVAVLLAPQFLHYIPRSAIEGQVGAPANLADWELAARLSSMLWNSVPDNTLRDSAAKGTLKTETESKTQVQRLIASTKADRFYDAFFSQWLGVNGIENFAADLSVFPNWNANLANSMKNETKTFSLAALRNNRPPVDFLNANYSYVDQTLAQHYGIAGVTGSEFRMVTLPATRAGVLTQGSVLTMTSKPTHTSPIKRGYWTLFHMLCDPPPPPPANVEILPPTTGAAEGDIRKLLAEHRTNATCASCHNKMDPLGLSYENYNAIGQYRSAYKNGLAIDASGMLPTNETFNNVIQLGQILQSSVDFKNCFSSKLVSYATGSYVARSAYSCEIQGVRNSVNPTTGLQDVIGAMVRSPFFK